MPWGVTFSDPNSMAITGTAIHPTQLYESAAEACIFIFLMIFRKKKGFDGQLLWLYVLLYSSIRFLIEFFRGDPGRGMITNNFSAAQGISLLLAGAALYFLKFQRKKGPTLP
jgi:phosphatidylglycerol:prolipoprotein diacylglycerol transferase